MTLYLECPICHAEWSLIELTVQMCQSCLYNANNVAVPEPEIQENAFETLLF